jgi:hypothetical protein
VRVAPLSRGSVCFPQPESQTGAGCNGVPS